MYPADFPQKSGYGRRYRVSTLFLVAESLSIGFAVGIEEFLAALLPRRLEFGRRGRRLDLQDQLAEPSELDTLLDREAYLAYVREQG